jgi:CTD small phosphatase-like protein 2
MLVDRRRRPSLKKTAPLIIYDADEHGTDPSMQFLKNSPQAAFTRTRYQQPVPPATGKVRLNSPKNPKIFTFEETQPQPPPDIDVKMQRSPSHYVLQPQSNSRGLSTGRSSATPKAQTLRSSASTRSISSPKASDRAIRAPRPQVGTSKNLSSVVTAVKQVEAKGDSLYKEHLFQTFQAMKFVRSIPPCDERQLRDKTQYLAKRPGYQHKKTVIFDLDETLVHCCENVAEAQVPITIPLPTGELMKAGINIRPYAREVLMSANQDFEVIVFTASHRCYADVVLNYLDPTGALIHHRLYRDNCIITDGVHIKDLRVLGNRRLQDLVIVDNAAYSFGYQLDNGIPIISWYSDPTDRELYNLVHYLKVLAAVDDIRSVNRQTFHLHTFYQDYLQDFMRPQDKENV